MLDAGFWMKIVIFSFLSSIKHQASDNKKEQILVIINQTI
jgi:hypothetical protein